VLVGKGSVVGRRLVEHPDVAKIGFTGSTEVGREVMRGAAGTIRRVTLELGGKSASVIFGDADLERAAASAPYAVFDNAGQDCCARGRILVQEAVYDDFLKRFTDATARVRVGDPGDERTEMGPLISAAHRETVAGFVEASNDDRIAREEVFGPVAAVIPFSDEADAVRLANGDAVRSVGLDLDARRRPRAAGRPRARIGRALRQLELLGAPADAVRRRQAVGRRAGARDAGARGVLGVKNVFISTEA
jgi:acyl-CoA reductase-like NAD-dependent aldehyde dehydrogenase